MVFTMERLSKTAIESWAECDWDLKTWPLNSIQML